VACARPPAVVSRSASKTKHRLVPFKYTTREEVNFKYPDWTRLQKNEHTLRADGIAFRHYQQHRSLKGLSADRLYALTVDDHFREVEQARGVKLKGSQKQLSTKQERAFHGSAKEVLRSWADLHASPVPFLVSEEGMANTERFPIPDWARIAADKEGYMEKASNAIYMMAREHGTLAAVDWQDVARQVQRLFPRTDPAKVGFHSRAVLEMWRELWLQNDYVPPPPGGDRGGEG